MEEILYRDRESGELREEKVYGRFFLEALYSSRPLSKVFSLLLLPLIAKLPFFSKLYGKRQSSPKSRAKILPFIESYGVDASEFANPIKSFQSFNDFFIRKLKAEARPLAEGDKVAILPADGRYLVTPDLSAVGDFFVKEKKFDLHRLLQDDALFDRYREGSMVIGRLCPSDYHRFHFPCASLPSNAKPINGPLYSVNPIALKKRISILNENKRSLTQLQTKYFGNILYIEVGATFVGAIRQTYTPEVQCKKGAEKGYFEFGGSCLILLFQPETITFDQDLLDASLEQIETKANFGDSLGRCR
ncbi:MAG: Phosphatidylserine decarboxylase proenzyme [Chlamydiae bacterium]|nr:Phosphatidylserine decarboxylase proenzyme [Chlamydiota bacterium]